MGEQDERLGILFNNLLIVTHQMTKGANGPFSFIGYPHYL